MEDGDDDFGELYADVDFQTNSSIIFDSQIAQFSILRDQQQLHCADEATGVDKRRENDLEMHNVGGDEVRVMIDSERGEEDDGDNDDDEDDDDDDFEVFVNDEDLGAKNGGGDAKRCSDEMVENVEGEFGIGVVEGSLIGKNKMQVGFDEVEHGVGGNGDGCGGERGNVGKIPSNSECKYKKRNGSVSVGSQRATSSWKAEGEDVWYGKPRISRCVPSLAVNGNNFWLPWYKSIVDVDIDTIEQKSWTYPGADITDYFNYDFDEESWRNYCQSLDQLRRRMLSQTKNHVKESLRFKLKNDAGAIEEMQSDDFFRGESIQLKQFGQAIHVEDSNTERQPSTDAKRPRIRDVDAIEITVQDSDKPSNSVIEEQCNTRVTQCNIVEKKCDPANSEADSEQPDVPKAYEMAKSSREETFRSSNVSCDSKRSYESATVSSHVLQHSNAHGKDQNSELDIEPSERGNTSSGQNLRATGTAVNSMKDVDNGSESAETNLYMAGIDLSFDDHGPNSRSPSCSDTCYEASQDYFGYSKIRKLRRSSDFKKEKPQVAHIDYQRSRRYRNGKNVNDNNYKYRIRVKNSAEENLKHHGRRVGRRVNSKHNYGVDHSRAHLHLRSGERCRSTSDDEYWSGDKDNGYSPGNYDKKYVEKRLQVECMRGFGRRDRWGFRDEVDVYFQRQWSEEQLSYDRSMRRVKGVTVQKDWHVKGRDCIIRDKTPCSQDEKLMLKFSSSHDINCIEEQMESDDIDCKKGNRHHQPLQYRYADEHVHDRYLRLNTLDDRHREHEDLDFKHERRSWWSRRELRTSGRGEYFENSMDVDYPRYTMDDDYEYWNSQTFASTDDLRDALLNDERSLRNTRCRDDTNDPELYQIYERQTNSISGRKCGGSRHVYDHRVAYNRQDPPTYLDEDDYFGRRQIVFHSHGGWTEDSLFDGSSYHEFRGGSILDSFKAVSRCKGHGVKHEYVRGGVTNNKQITRGRIGVVECDKSHSKMSTQANFEGNEPWERKELLYTDRERKSTGNFPKAGIIPNNGADGRFRDQYERRQEQDGTLPDKTMKKKTKNVEASGDVLPTTSRPNTSEVEEGQIPSEEPRKEILKGRKYVSGHLVLKDNLERRSGHCELTQNEDHVYDENQILEIMAKMEKRRERFKDPVLVKKDTDSDNKPEEGKVVESMDAKQRPTRKRKWV